MATRSPANPLLYTFHDRAPLEDVLCREVEIGERTGMAYLPDLLGSALEATAGVPVTVHGLELSIGTAAGWNAAYLAILDQFQRLRRFAWHSEHLGYLLASRRN